MRRPRGMGCLSPRAGRASARRRRGPTRRALPDARRSVACELLRDKTIEEGKQAMRLAAAADLHVKKSSQGALQPLLAPVNDHADVLLLCGDLTDYGLREEAAVLAKELNAVVRIPMVAVLGNHDYESGQQEDVCRILTEAGVKILDGEAYEIGGVGIAGAKGFSGGFGRATLGAWGEQATKRYV